MEPFRKVQFEITVRCNLNCRLCYSNTPEVQKRGDMPLPLFKQIVDDLDPSYHALNLWGTGEPLLNNHFFTMTGYAARKGPFRMKVTTNGTLLHRENRKRLLESGLSCIRISLDAADEEDYNRARPGGDFRTLLSRIEALCVEREKSNAPVRIDICSVAQPGEPEKNDEVISLARKLGADQHELQNNIWGGGTNRNKLPPPRRCSQPMTTFYLQADGTVIPCCYTCKSEIIIGDVHKNRPGQIWENQDFQDFRENFRKGTGQYCPQCNFSDSFTTSFPKGDSV